MSFWDFFLLLLVYIPLFLLWWSAIIDIFRRDDISGISKALWVAVVILLPFLGTLVYLILRKPGATPAERRAPEQGGGIEYLTQSTAKELSLLADLHDRGKLTDDEFGREKARLLGTPVPAPASGVPA